VAVAAKVGERPEGLSAYGGGLRLRERRTASEGLRDVRTYQYEGQVLGDGGTSRRRVTETGPVLREAPAVVVQRGTRPGSPIALVSFSFRDRATGRCVNLALEDSGRAECMPQVTVHTGDEQVIFVETPPELAPRRGPRLLRRRDLLSQAVGCMERLRDAPEALDRFGVDTRDLDFAALVDASSPEALMRHADLVL
jgi:hypothetical protein